MHPRDMPLEALVEHWSRQARKLTDAGVPIERVAESMRTVLLDVEHERSVSPLRKAKDRLAALREAWDKRPLTETANHSVMPGATRVATEEKTTT